MLDATPFPGESLRGLSLRVLPSDGPIRALRDALRLGVGQMPAREDIGPLSRLLGVSPHWAADHFCGHSRVQPSVRRIGRHPALGAHLNGKFARVCVRCLKENGATHIAWELSLVTCCPRHLIELLEECPHCEQPLKWDRPSLTVCRCGHDITLAHTRRCSLEAADFAARISAALIPAATQVNGFGLLPAFMHGLSAPMQCAIVHAYGALERKWQAPKSNDVRKHRAKDYWDPVLRRAVDRLRRVECAVNVAGEVNDSVLLAQARLETKPDLRRLCLQLVSDESAQYVATQRQGKLALKPA